jgi:hypothetical protein
MRRFVIKDVVVIVANPVHVSVNLALFFAFFIAFWTFAQFASVQT